MVPAMSGGGTPDFMSALVEALPAAAFVIDTEGTVRFATEAAAELVERAPAELIGRSVLEFVDEDTAWAYAAAVAMAGDHPDQVMGPMRITIVTAQGKIRAADLWATNRSNDPAVQGIVCLLTAETTAVGLAEAVTALANEADFPAVAARVVRAMRGHPTVADAVLLSAGPSGFRPVAASREDLPAPLADGPWDAALSTGVRQVCETLDELPDAVRTDAVDRGFATVWVEPIASAGTPRGVLLLWRDHPGRPTPNELNAVHQGAAIIRLAWERHEAQA
jgi:PAS domain-containing protein